MRHCLDCGRLTDSTRCHTCHRRKRNNRYGGNWTTRSRTTIAAHLATHGPTCPGWQRPPHPINAADLTLDHETGVLCRACNSAKRDRG
jgi:hypothetical protein